MRYLPLTPHEKELMLKKIGVKNEEELFKPVPKNLMFRGTLNIPPAHSEAQITERLKGIAARNQYFPLEKNFAGAGLYAHYVPAAVDHVAGRGEFLTAYTPYQPEISQGTLQTIFEFQTMMARILDAEFCNASHYDGSTAAAEVCLMAQRLRPGRKTVVGLGRIHPGIRQVMKTYFSHQPESLKFVRTVDELKSLRADTVAAVMVQTPDFYGALHRWDDVRAWTQANGALFAVSVSNPTAFGAFEPPSDVDLYAGEASCLGNGPNFGGPLLGFIAGKLEFARQAPGRLIGKTTDARGRTVYTITLATREQHIRREKATSNICTNEGLCLVRATIHLAMLGRQGFQELSLATYNNASAFFAQAQREKLTPQDPQAVHYQEFCFQLPGSAERAVEEGVKQGMLLGVPVKRVDPDASEQLLLVCMNETHSDDARTRWFETYRKVTL
jgi:glycine dehydrogenase subunit 1